MSIKNKIEDSIIQWANRISKKRESKPKKEFDCDKHKDVLKSHLLEKLEVISNSYKLEELTDLKVGNVAILNYYNLKPNRLFGWEGGLKSIIDNSRDFNEDIMVKITDVILDKSLVYNRVDIFIEKFDIKDMTLENVWNKFERWIEHINLNYLNINEDNKWGFYSAVYFDTNCPFKPKWSLNTNSFLKYGKREYDMTKELRKKDMMIRDMEKSLNSLKLEFGNDKKMIKNEFKKS
jgi:hypothetical protein